VQIIFFKNLFFDYSITILRILIQKKRYYDQNQGFDTLLIALNDDDAIGSGLQSKGRLPRNEPTR
jgi:hypothetical protein